MLYGKKLKIVAVGLLLVLAGCASLAKIIYPVTTDPLKSKPGVYALDSDHANIIFSLNHLGFSLHHGRFNKITGSLEPDTSAPEASQLFITITTASIDTNNQILDDELRSPKMFDASAFPAATYQSTSIRQTGDTTAVIEGVLNIKGVEKPVTIEATFIGSGVNPLTGLQTIGFSGKGSFKRSDFGLKEWLPFIGDDVALIIEAEFTRPK
ncbi:MAG: polyisoprenoid-binding protein [Kordiimonadaceae bacterium]|nr:polyisoprenoid-binding protein [Kordiimonadaceae bacterium]